MLFASVQLAGFAEFETSHHVELGGLSLGPQTLTRAKTGPRGAWRPCSFPVDRDGILLARHARSGSRVNVLDSARGVCEFGMLRVGEREGALAS